MRHLYCTVAIGDLYVQSAITMAKRLNEKSTSHHMLIATNKEYEEVDNLTYVMLPEDSVLFTRNIFNYNLKYYPLYVANQMDYDHIIFIDSDWRIRDEYDENNIHRMLNFMDEQNIDMFYERPHSIGAGKHDGNQCFWRHKRDFYKLLETDVYDTGHVCNEQFMVFKKSDKFNVFVNKWKELYEMAAEADLWGYAEGVEIGMSYTHANMVATHTNFEHFIRAMYEFTAISQQIYIRY